MLSVATGVILLMRTSTLVVVFTFASHHLISSPGFTVPEATVLQNPLKSSPGLLTNCTGYLKSSKFLSLATCTVSKNSSMLFP
jgi:hypothetical protein